MRLAQYGPLPTERMEMLGPFHNISVENLGPYTLKRSTHGPPSTLSSEGKVWIVLVTCLGSRAIHLEPCIGVSAQELQSALIRVFGRRGTSKVIWSDYALCFQAASELIHV
jgi:hypothetical protein